MSRLGLLWVGMVGHWQRIRYANHPMCPNSKKSAVLQQRVHCLSLLCQLYNLEATASSRRFACLAMLMQKNSAEEFANEAQVNQSLLYFQTALRNLKCWGERCCQVPGFIWFPDNPDLTGHH